MTVGSRGQVRGRRVPRDERDRNIPHNAIGQERERVRRTLIQRGPLDEQSLVDLLGLAVGTVASHLEELRKAGSVRRNRDGLWAFREASRRLPITGHMVPGEGPRHDCARYDACLDAFVGAMVASARGRIGSGEVDGHCGRSCLCRGERTCELCHGTGCRWHEAVPERRATDYMRRDDYDASIFCGGDD